jgi:tRNA(Ile)-lysidine synthetase-like protein
MKYRHHELLRTLLHSLPHDKLDSVQFAENAGLLVAVSGGMDSVAMLHALCEARRLRPLRLHVATLNHSIRPEAEADVAHVVALCQAWDVPYTVGVVDAPAHARTTRQSLEAAARALRYRFLAQTASALKLAYVTTAHHADDQAETVLLHLLRGTGTRGLGGMRQLAPMPAHPSLWLLRPLLGVTRAQIADYVAKYGIRWREDASNADTTYTRNYVRHEVWRALERVNPASKQALLRLADSARADEDFIAQAYEAQVSPHSRQEATRWQVARPTWLAWHEALQRRWLMRACEALAGADAPLRAFALARALNSARDGATGDLAPLAGGVRLRLAYGAVVVEREDAPLPTDGYPLLAEEGQILRLHVGDTVTLGAWQLHVAGAPTPHASAMLALPPQATLILRARRAGERIALLGMGGAHKTLKDLYIERAIPRHLRARVPVLEADGVAVAVLLPQAWAIAEAVAVRPDAPYPPTAFVLTPLV